MSNVYTLRDIENKGHRLGSIRESELENALRNSIKTSSDLSNEYKALQDVYSAEKLARLRREKDFGNRINQLNDANTEIEAKYSAEVKSLKSLIKVLEGKLALAQKDSSMKNPR